MNFVSIFMAVFSMLGALDLLLKNRFGIGKEFEKGIMFLGILAMSMLGMIVLAPVIGDVISPVLELGYKYLGIDPSLLPTLIFANDMGGTALAEAVAKDPVIGEFNGLVVAAMFGCTISFTLPVALGLVKKENQKYMLFGFLCGIMTIPIGCFVSGLMRGINVSLLFFDLLPVIIFAGVTAVGLWFAPGVCMKIFAVIGEIIKALIIVGLALGILKFLTGLEPIKNLESLESAAMICVSASVVMTGAFPFMYIVSKLISKPLKKISAKVGINETSAFGFFSTLTTNVTTFERMNEMDKKGIALNSAFAISAGFTFAGHLAFTMSYNVDYIYCVIVGKLVSGISALILASIMYKRSKLD